MFSLIKRHSTNATIYFSKSYDLLLDNRIKFILAVGVPLFIMFFLWFFGPFGLILFSDIIKLKLISAYCIIGSIIFISHLYLIQNSFIKHYTIGNTILWLIWINFVIGFSNFIIWAIIMNNGQIIWKYLPKMLTQSTLVGLLPITTVILFYNTYYLRKNIKVINRINTDLSRYKNRVLSKSEITLTSTNLREVITIDSNLLLYIASADNYVEIHLLEREQVQKYLIRKTLKEIELELKIKFNFFARCHNSYIVNINQIKAITGNSRGYKILLYNIDNPIPISRKYKSPFLDLIGK